MYGCAVQFLYSTQVAIAAQMRTGGGERVGRHATGAGLEIGEVYGPDEISIVDAEGLVLIVELREPTRALKDVGAHGTVGEKRTCLQGCQNCAHRDLGRKTVVRKGGRDDEI